MSTPLDRGSVVPLCVVCIEAGRATEATRQTRDLWCGCDEHIQELEQDGLAAIRRQRSAVSRGYMDCGAPPAGGTADNWAADSRDQGALVPATGALANRDAAVGAGALPRIAQHLWVNRRTRNGRSTWSVADETGVPLISRVGCHTTINTKP